MFRIQQPSPKVIKRMMVAGWTLGSMGFALLLLFLASRIFHFPLP
jgi:hypothetical protein